MNNQLPSSIKDDYSYIYKGNKVWVKNIETITDPEKEPYEIKTITSCKASLQRIEFDDGTSINDYYLTLPLNKTNDPNEIDKDDLIDIKQINKVDILNNLHNRLIKGKIFTNLGPILLIVNPYTDNDDDGYSHKILDAYMINQGSNQKPHLNKLVMNALKELSYPNAKNQVLIINGESGSGKTEASLNAIKFINSYFNKPHCTYNANSIEAKILHSHFILSCFGNAKTIHNDNSSRFGKYIKIQLNKDTNAICGINIQTYQLDKSRITDLNILERNYHIFYYLLNGGDDTLLTSLHLSHNIKDYAYLYQSKEQITSIITVNDREMYSKLIMSLNSIGFNEEDRYIILKAIAAVLLIGNIEPSFKNEECAFEPIETYVNICDLLGCNETLLNTVLSRKPPNFGSKEYGGLYKENDIKMNKNALARELYNKVFLWIVTKINSLLEADINISQIKHIGIIDFYGYESYSSNNDDNKENNSITQLYINYTQEQLQQLFFKTIGKIHYSKYEEQGLLEYYKQLNVIHLDDRNILRQMKILFNKTCDNISDNQLYTIISLFKTEIEKKTRKDPSYQKITQLKIKTNPKDEQSFIIDHSFQSIQYTIKNFYHNNQDQLKPNIIDCFLSSTNQLIQQIFTNTLTEQYNSYIKSQILRDRLKPDANSLLMKYIGSKMLIQLKDLKNELNDSTLHFILCIKPNNTQEQWSLFPNYVYNQIAYNKLVDIVKIISDLYPIKYQYDQFFDNNCHVLDMTSSLKTKTIDEYKKYNKLIIQKIMSDQYAINDCLYGKTMMFMKENIAIQFNKKITMIPQSTSKSRAAEVLIVGIYYLHKQRKVKQITKNVKYLQDFFIKEMSRPGRDILYKKKAINIIQSAIKTSFTYRKFNKMIKHKQSLIAISNSCKIILARKYIVKLRRENKLIAIRMKIFLSKRSIKLKSIMNKIIKKIIRVASYNIFYDNYNDLWLKILPFVIMHQVQRNNKTKIKTMTKALNYWRKDVGMKLFQQCHFFNKIRTRLCGSKYIFSYASTQIASEYYNQLRINILLIQAYVNTEKKRKKILKKVTNDILLIEDNKKKIRMQMLAKILFPNYQLSSYYFMKEGFEAALQNNPSCYKSIRSQSLQTFITPNNTSNINYTYQNNCSSTKQLRNNINTLSSPLLLTHCNNRNISMTSFEKQSVLHNITMNEDTSYQGIFPRLERKIEANIFLFAKILDFDMICDDSETYQDSWAKYFTKVYEYCLHQSTPIEILQVSNTHTLALNNKGRVFAWGLNNHNQCGITQQPSTSAISSTALTQSTPKLAASSSMPKLSRYEKIPKSSHEKEEPFSIPQLFYHSDHIQIFKSSSNSCRKMIAGEDYTTILTNTGNVYSFGNNSKGQFAKGNRKDYSNISLWINNNIDGNKYVIRDIYSAGKFNAFITNKNEFFIWNISHKNISVNPTRIYLDKKITIKNVSCGKNFMIILSENGMLYGTGSNSHGELCDEENRVRTCPEELHLINKQEDKIIQVRCGFKHVVALSLNGNAYTWGNNTFGQLGHYNTKDSSLSKIQLPIEGKIIQVTAGFRSTIVFTGEREIFFCGKVSEENQAFSPTFFNIKVKSIEYFDRNKFSPVRILSTWNQSFSIFYATMADTRLISQHLLPSKVNEILNALARNWIEETINAPFDLQASYVKYIDTNCIEKPIDHL